tara:strand:+ start:385 stop:486 length:102 start_codon:yes stop_codon:yes gene_type:complete
MVRYDRNTGNYKSPEEMPDDAIVTEAAHKQRKE